MANGLVLGHKGQPPTTTKEAKMDDINDIDGWLEAALDIDGWLEAAYDDLTHIDDED
jgi:hypothetical protein